MMKRAICLVLGLSLVSLPAWAGNQNGDELTCPVEILKKADAACKAVKTVQYDFTFEGVGKAFKKVGKVEGTVIAQGFAKGLPEKCLVDFEATSPESEEVHRITGGADGEMFYLVDHTAKTVIEGTCPKMEKHLSYKLRAGIMVEFFVDEPYGHEISGKVQELRGSKEINGEDCYEVYVVYATEKPQAAIWYFSKEDFLPRGRVDEFPMSDGGKFVQQRMISNLIVDPELEEDTFEMEFPEGYSKIEGAAPWSKKVPCSKKKQKP